MKASPEPPVSRALPDTVEGALADDAVWQRVRAVASTVDERLAASDARLTVGGEPTFVSATNRQSQCWWFSPLAPDKLAHAWTLGDMLWRRWAPGGILLLTSGKSYPGETEPRWSLACVWRRDGVPLWKARELLTVPDRPGTRTGADAERFLLALADRYGLPRSRIRPIFHAPSTATDDRSGMIAERGGTAVCAPRSPGARFGAQGPGDACAGFALPFAADQASHPVDGRLVLEPGGAPIGFRLSCEAPCGTKGCAPRAVCAEVREGHLHVCLPAASTPERYFTLLAAVEATAAALDTPVVLTGHLPPPNAPVEHFSVAPDPGVIEVNLAPAASWPEWEARVTELYCAAEEVGLDARRFQFNGEEVGTGGGNHIMLGGPTPSESPFCRRPDVLASMITYWHNHPSLSYAFASVGVGPCSQHPRVDESWHGATWDLEIALAKLAQGRVQPHDVLRYILVDATGNAHRAEFCIDKLAPPSDPKSLGGLLELRAFEMQPTARMNLLVHLLVRALFTWFWERPYRAPLKRWGARLHDAYMLPAVLRSDFCTVLDDLADHGFFFDLGWFDPLWNWRFPVVGRASAGAMELELRRALEPWVALHDLGATRLVDSSMERLQVRLSGSGVEDCILLCNGYRLRPRRLRYATPAGNTPTTSDVHALGIRFRGWTPSDGIHPDIPPHSPLVFEVWERKHGALLMRCIYHAFSPDGGPYPGYPESAGEAQRRRADRFMVVPLSRQSVVRHAKWPGHDRSHIPVSSDHPLTADLCWAGTEPWGVQDVPGPKVSVPGTLRNQDTGVSVKSVSLASSWKLSGPYRMSRSRRRPP